MSTGFPFCPRKRASLPMLELLPPPALSELRHRSLARRRVAVHRSARYAAGGGGGGFGGLGGGGLYRVPEIVTRGRFPDGGKSDSTWRTQEARHVGSDTIAPGF